MATFAGQPGVQEQGFPLQLVELQLLPKALPPALRSLQQPRVGVPHCEHQGEQLGAAAGRTVRLEPFLSRLDRPRASVGRAPPCSSLFGPGSNAHFWVLPALEEGCCLLQPLDACAEPLQVSPGGLQPPQKGLRGLGTLAHILNVPFLNTAPFFQPGSCLWELGWHRGQVSLGDALQGSQL